MDPTNIERNKHKPEKNIKQENSCSINSIQTIIKKGKQLMPQPQFMQEQNLKDMLLRKT